MTNSRQLLTFCLLFLVSLTIQSSILAFVNEDVSLESGATLEVNRFDADGKTLFIWLPSERGLGPGYLPVADNLSKLGIDVWVVDLHNSYMEPTGRSSVSAFKPGDTSALISRAVDKGFDHILILTAGRSAKLALETGALWQQKNNHSRLLAGYIFLHPHLIIGQPEMGKNAIYDDIVLTTSLPIYYIQPEYSPKFLRTAEIQSKLGAGGSPVYTHILNGINGGFHMRPEEDLTDKDLALRTRLPALLFNAYRLLVNTVHPKRIPNLTGTSHVILTTPTITLPTLQPYKGNPQPAALKLPDLRGNPTTLKQYQGKVVLINFWATWCTPCVEEIPSMGRLIQQMQGKPFNVLSINIGEPNETIESFIKKIPVNFPILIDHSGDTVRDWKVYAYPANFIIDKSGLIRYAYAGALDWDAPDIIFRINNLITEGTLD